MSDLNGEHSSQHRSRRILFSAAGLTLLILLFIVHITGIYPILPDHFSLFGSGRMQLADITSGSGIDSYKRVPIYDENPSYLEVMGGGVAVADIDGDSWEDILFTGMPSFDPDFMGDTTLLSKLYRNEGDGTFSDITAEAGLSDIKGYPMGALFFDYDNNGTQDLYIAAFQGGQLFRNDGGFFVDVTDSAGLNTTGLCGTLPCIGAAASAGDYNRDGHLDLLIVNNAAWNKDNPAHFGEGSLTPAAYPGQPTFLYRNNGDGTFTNVSEVTGVNNKDSKGYREDGKGLSAVWTDINNDGWPDIYIANDLSPNRLYLNTGEGTFVEIGQSGFVDEMKSSMGVDAADYNYNGYDDLTTTNLKAIMTSLYRNYGNLRFDYATFYTGIMPSARSSGWGIVFVDLDMDGYQDLVMAGGPIWDNYDESENIFFKNLGTGKFRDITDQVVHFPNDHISRGLAVTDVDRSGTPDLVFSNIDGAPPQLLKNKSTGNNWIRIDLEGTESNRDAVGAKVTVERSDGFISSQLVKAGNSYISSGSKSLFFGLGKATIRKLTVDWPSGRKDTLEDVDINEIIHIREGLRK